MSISNLFSPNDFNIYANSLNINQINLSNNSYIISGNSTVPASTNFTVLTIPQIAPSCGFWILFDICGIVISGPKQSGTIGQSTGNRISYKNNTITTDLLIDYAEANEGVSSGDIGQNFAYTQGPGGVISLQISNNLPSSVCNFNWTVKVLQIS